MKMIGIVGGGMIGTSMACMFAGHGVKVTLIEQEGYTEKARENCVNIYTDLVKKGFVTPQQKEICLSYISISTDYALLASMEFIFECVYERTSVKYAVYEQLERHCTNVKAIASSTSAISADELAAGFKTDMGKCLVVAHPWNPPHLAPCVELVRSQIVSDEAVALVEKILTEMGKKTVTLQKNIPGFIGNRLQYAMLREAIHIVEEGAATPEMVDATLKYSFAPRYTQIGIFEHFDNCGQDLTDDICRYLFPDLCDEKTSQRILKANVENGNLGVKSGRGMLDWSGVDLDEFRNRAASAYYRFFDWKLPTEKAEKV